MSDDILKDAEEILARNQITTAPQPVVVQQAQATVQPAQQAAPNELLIKGAIMGVVVFVVWALIAGTKALVKSPSEGARRFKIVGGVGLTALVTYIAALERALPELMILAVIVAGITWVMKGFAKK